MPQQINFCKNGRACIQGETSAKRGFDPFEPIAVITVTLTLAFVVAGGEMAASGATLQLSGVVPNVKEITIDPAPGYNGLDLSTSAVDVLVLTAHERANSAGGYTVTVESANAVSAGQNTASLNNVTAGTDKLNYTLKYDGVAVVLGSSGVVGRAKVTDLNAKTPLNGSGKALQISYDGNQQLASGIYQDTLTFSIVAK